MAHLRGWIDAGAVPSSSLARLRYKPLLGQHYYIPVGAGGGYGIILPPGIQVIFDFARFYEGEIAFAPMFDDSRMVLRGDPLPPYSGDERYSGGIKIDVLLQSRGLCVLTSTSASLIRAIDLLYDNFVVSPEAQAGQMAIYRIEEPRSYTIQQRADLLYAPVYTLIGWAGRDGLKLGSRLIPRPKPLPALNAVTPPALEDSAFETASRTGAVMPPEPKTPRRERADKLAAAGDLDDEIPF